MIIIPPRKFKKIYGYNYIPDWIVDHIDEKGTIQEVLFLEIAFQLKEIRKKRN
jgi:hypothetical protein